MSENKDSSSIERALLLLETLLEQSQGVEIPEFLTRLDVSRSSLFVLLNTLKTLGYVEQAEKRGRYRAGPRLLAWRGGTTLAPNLLLAFHQEASAAALAETILLALPAGTGALLVAQFEGAAQVRSLFPAGFQFPPESAPVQALQHSPAAEIVQNGYALSFGPESVELALPICRDGLAPVAALVLSAPLFRWGQDRLTEHLPRLREMAARLSYRLGAMRYTPWKPVLNDSSIQRRALNTDQTAAFLSAPWIARLACLRPDGTPHVVPVWQEWDGQHFYVTAWQGSLWAEYLLVNPKVSLAIDEPWPPLRRVLARGQAFPLQKSDLPGGLNGLLNRLRRRYLGQNSTLPAAHWQAFRIVPNSLTAWQGLT